jgi:hypothetical protein
MPHIPSVGVEIRIDDEVCPRWGRLSMRYRQNYAAFLGSLFKFRFWGLPIFTKRRQVKRGEGVGIMGWN